MQSLDQPPEGVNAAASLLPREVVGPLVRGLAVLRELAAAEEGRLSPGELVRATGLARSTVDRVVGTLARTGYLRLEGRDAVLAPRLMELGNAYLAASGLPDLLGPHADALAEELDEPVSIAVPDADGARCVHQTPRRRAMALTFRIGELLPAERSAPGALFAAHQPPLEAGPAFAERVATARTQGWSVDDQLLEPGLLSVAMPVYDAEGGLLCAVSVASHTSRHSAASLAAAVLPRLRETVDAMSSALSASPRPGAAPAARGAAALVRAAKEELGPEYVESLARGLAVLTAFGEGRAGMSLSALAEATGLARATVRRSLITLQHLGYAVQEGRGFRLTPRVLELGFAPLSGLTLPQIAQPHLAALVARVHDSASMTVLADQDIQYVARVPTVRIMSVSITVGTRFPAYATSMGRVLLAGLPVGERAVRLAATELAAHTRYTVTSADRLAGILEEVALEGYALVDEELEDGLRSIAVPVRDRGGRVIAAINVSMHASRRTAAQARAELLPRLREAAERIEGDAHVAGRFVRILAV